MEKHDCGRIGHHGVAVSRIASSSIAVLFALVISATTGNTRTVFEDRRLVVLDKQKVALEQKMQQLVKTSGKSNSEYMQLLRKLVAIEKRIVRIEAAEIKRDAARHGGRADTKESKELAKDRKELQEHTKELNDDAKATARLKRNVVGNTVDPLPPKPVRPGLPIPPRDGGQSTIISPSGQSKSTAARLPATSGSVDRLTGDGMLSTQVKDSRRKDIREPSGDARLKKGNAPTITNQGGADFRRTPAAVELPKPR
jgi:hypothetical protein